MLYGIDLHHTLSHQSLIEPPFRGSNTTSPIPPAATSLAQLAHNEALRQHQQALLSQSQHHQQQQQQRNSNDATGLLGVPNVKKVSSGTLGSPFNEQGQAQTGVQGVPTAAGNGGNAAAVVGSQNNVPIVRQPVPKKHTASSSNKAIGKGRPDNKAKQAFPSAQDTSMNSSNTTLNNNNNGTRNVKNELSSSTSRNKKPPSSNARYISGAAAAGTVGRGRKTSDASERSIRKDDLLDRLADALKYVVFPTTYKLIPLRACMRSEADWFFHPALLIMSRAERKLVKLYQEELKSAESEMTKVCRYTFICL